jgi:hypothetical protein
MSHRQRRARSWLEICTLVLFLLAACAGPTGTVPADKTAVAEPTETPPIATLTLTVVPSPSPTPTPTATAMLPPPLPPMPMPTGLALYAREGTGLLLFSLMQQVTARVDIPVAGGMVHIAGTVPEGTLAVPVVYYDGEQHALQLVFGGAISTVASVPNLIALIGAPGQPVLAYTSLEFMDQGLRSHLYAGTLPSLATAAPVLNVTNLESYAVHPLAVRTEGGQPAGVWYTYEPYGIGGDIVYPPRSALYYLELSTGTSMEVLAREMRPSSLSLDQAWIAFVPGPLGPLTIRDLATGKEIAFPLLPDSDRGAGRAVFSPTNQYVAWMEASGSMWADPSTFQATVRIASTSGELIADVPAAKIPNSVLAGISGSKDMWLVPAGWLDESTILLQVTYGSPEQSIVLQASCDGTDIQYVAPGILAELLYPE